MNSIPWPLGTAVIRLTVKERILLHLLEFAKAMESFDAPTETTQTGIARAVRIEVSHVPQYVRPLVRAGLVLEKTAHVKGGARRRKAYVLTSAGLLDATRLRETLKSEAVRVADASGEREATVAQIIRDAGPSVSFLDLVTQAMESGVVDLASLRARTRPLGPEFIERLADAPRIERFVGRKEELERITGPLDQTRVFVIQGLAGIGKSSLAAKACDLLRGSRNLFWHRVRSWDSRSSFLAKLADFLAAAGRPRLRSVLARGDGGDPDQVVRQDLPGIQAVLVIDDAQEATPEVLAVLAFLKDVTANAAALEMLVLSRRSVPFYDRRDVVLTRLVSELELEGLGEDDIKALVGEGKDAKALVDLGRRLGGHPLSLQLLRSATPVGPRLSMGQVQRFVEEQIYRELGAEERALMKAASLYQVPVPRTVLLSTPSTSHDVLLSLQNRALLRLVGDDDYEIHETIRDFFNQTLTPTERDSLGRFAADQLEGLAMRDYRIGDYVACINGLENALELIATSDVDSKLTELLGDAYDRIGDLPGALRGYRQALRATIAPNDRARIHRKAAAALEDRGDIASASKEIEEGLEAVGTGVMEERGWLDLIRARIDYRLADWERARDAGERGLATFGSFDVPAGKARISLILGHIAMHSPQGDPDLAERHLENALELSSRVEDNEFTADVRIALAHLLAWHRKDLPGALRHIEAVEASLRGSDLPNVRRKFRLLQGMLRLLFFADYEAARAHFRSVLEEAQSSADQATAGNAQVGLGYVAYFQGQFAEARRIYEEAAAALRARGLLVDTVNLLLAISEAYLLEGNQPASTKVFMDLLSEPSLSRAIDARSFYIRLSEGFFLFFQGDPAGSAEAFTDAVNRTSPRLSIGEGTMTYDFVGCISWPGIYAHLYAGVGFRFLGRPSEGDQHIAKAREIAEAFGAKGWLEAIPRIEARLTQVVRGFLDQPSSQTPPS